MKKLYVKDLTLWIDPNMFHAYEYWYNNLFEHHDRLKYYWDWNVEGNVVFDCKTEDDISLIPDRKMIEQLHQLMLDEFNVLDKLKIKYEKIQNDIATPQYLVDLWLDMDDDIVPGKNGRFYNSMKETVQEILAEQEIVDRWQTENRVAHLLPNP